MLADMIHHVRQDLAPAQLARVIKIYSAMVHNPALSGAIQTMCAKLLMTVTDSVTAKDTKEDAVHVLYILLESHIDKLRSIHTMHEELSTFRANTQSSEEISRALIEKA